MKIRAFICELFHGKTEAELRKEWLYARLDEAEEQVALWTVRAEHRTAAIRRNISPVNEQELLEGRLQNDQG